MQFDRQDFRQDRRLCGTEAGRFMDDWHISWQYWHVAAVGAGHASAFGSLLRRHRLAARLTQEDLAERSGLSVRAIANAESGRTRRPHRNSVRLLAQALGLAEQQRAELAASARGHWDAGGMPDARGAPVAPVQPTAVDRIVPRQLPAAVRCFTGRHPELATMTELARRPSGAQSPVLITAIGGTAGVGKTALAIQWAHQVAGQFPDGHLYVNLRGYDTGEPVAPVDALAGFLTALGLSGPQIPADAQERAAAYRSLLAGRRILVVLDNAREPAQVRPLLPGTPGCLAVVTSRDMLAGLVARDGAVRLELDALPLQDAVALLRELIGPQVDAETEAAARLAGLCCRLPLTLRVAAELAAARPGPLTALADELDGHGRLDRLDADGDQATAVRAVLSWSYRHLSAAAARAFRLSALHPGPDFDSRAMAALTATSYRHSREALAELSRAHLLWRADNNRYSTHDLLRAYGAELAACDEPEGARREAITRMLDYYLTMTVNAARLLFPTEAASLPKTDPADAFAAELTDEQQARAWLDAERANLAAAAAYAASHDRARHAIGLSAGLSRYLSVSGLMAEALVIHNAAVRAGVAAGDRLAEARAVISLGTVYLQLCRYPQAVQHCQRALALSREIPDQLGEIRALINLGQAYLSMGESGNAAECSQRALDLSRATGHRAREARALENLGKIALYQGRYRQASAILRQAVEANRRAGDRAGLTFALSNLGEVEVRQGRFAQAMSHLEEAKAISRQIGHVMGDANATYFLGLAHLRQGRLAEAASQLSSALEATRKAAASTAEACALCSLGEIDLRQGDITGAVGRFEQALALFRQAGERSGEAEARNCLGEAALAEGALGTARTHHREALDIASQLSNLEQQARAHDGLGDASAAAGDNAGARPHWQAALDAYAQLDMPDGERVRAKLAAAERRQAPARTQP
jgi:tetratricopeptide (TPR) repeat protein/DNA-binding XRE family transcriptional regulator